MHIGIVDSLLPESSEEFDDLRIKMDSTKNYVQPKEKDTTGHGTKVFDLLQFCAPESSFSFYRTIVEDPETKRGVAKRGNVVDAIYDAAQAGVDILNASIGVCHTDESGHDCGGACRIADEARMAINEDDLIIVAAIGNDRHAAAVTCPALVDGVIGVGGYVSRCMESVEIDEKSSQYWSNNDVLYGPFCGQRTCVNGNCDENRIEKPWDGNASTHNATPDTLGPVVKASETSEGQSSKLVQVLLHQSLLGV